MYSTWSKWPCVALVVQAGTEAGTKVISGEALSQEEMDEYMEEQKRISRAAAAALKLRSETQQRGAGGSGGQPAEVLRQNGSAPGEGSSQEEKTTNTVRRRPGRA
jgi:hypothetical protein